MAAVLLNDPASVRLRAMTPGNRSVRWAQTLPVFLIDPLHRAPGVSQ